jgi:hypothetical protein
MGGIDLQRGERRSPWREIPGLFHKTDLDLEAALLPARQTNVRFVKEPWRPAAQHRRATISTAMLGF